MILNSTYLALQSLIFILSFLKLVSYFLENRVQILSEPNQPIYYGVRPRIILAHDILEEGEQILDFVNDLTLPFRFDAGSHPVRHRNSGAGEPVRVAEVLGALELVGGQVGGDAGRSESFGSPHNYQFNIILCGDHL